jgi:hypothetical protein
MLAVNNTSSRNWLLGYQSSRGITYPFAYDSTSVLFNLYQVGSAYSNTPPTYIVIDQEGIVQYRTDDYKGHTEEIKMKIKELL